MGTTAYENKNRDNADPSERALRSQMVISYLRHRKYTNQEFSNTPQEMSIENEIRDPSIFKVLSPDKLSEDEINPSVLRAVKSKVRRLSQTVYDIKPEEMFSINPCLLYTSDAADE